MRTRTSSTRLLAALFLAGVALVGLLTAASGTPAAQVSLLPCPVRTVTGYACPGCGMTRACVAMARGELAEAWSLHPFAFLLVPLAALVVLTGDRSRDLWRRVPALVRSGTVALVLVCALGLWALRTM